MITSQNNRFSMGGGYRSFLIAAGSMLAAATALATTIDPSNYRCAMSISPAAGKVTSTISENFPLLVRLSSTRQLGFDPAECGVNGADLRFALADGTLLAHEIDTWNQTGESLVWVNVPSLAADTKVIAYWGVRDSSLAPAVNPASGTSARVTRLSTIRRAMAMTPSISPLSVQARTRRSAAACRAPISS